MSASASQVLRFSPVQWHPEAFRTQKRSFTCEQGNTFQSPWKTMAQEPSKILGFSKSRLASEQPLGWVPEFPALLFQKPLLGIRQSYQPQVKLRGCPVSRLKYRSRETTRRSPKSRRWYTETFHQRDNAQVKFWGFPHCKVVCRIPELVQRSFHLRDNALQSRRKQPSHIEWFPCCKAAQVTVSSDS